jgi:hypothetical protein
MKLCLEYLYEKVRFEVLTAVKMSMLVFWVVTPCGLVALKMEAVCSRETLVSTYKSTRRYDPEYEYRYVKRSWENLILVHAGNPYFTLI